MKSLVIVTLLASGCAYQNPVYPEYARPLPTPTTITLRPIAGDGVILVTTVLDQYGVGVPYVDVWLSVDYTTRKTDANGIMVLTIDSPSHMIPVTAYSGLLQVTAYVSPVVTSPPPIIPPPYTPAPPHDPLPGGGAPNCYPMPQCGGVL